jgi:ABC-type glycerol-3-phosphate transport system substrate-binding protein
MARSLFINVRTEHLEGVKDFLRYALSEKQQEKMVYEMDGYFPARQDVLKRLWKEAESELRDTGYTTDLSGNKQYEPRLMTKEEEQIFWHMLDCSVPSSYMNVINNIICEETALFFTDKKDADQVASSIQSRVQNYLDEAK